MMIKVKNLSFSYKTRRVLEDISFDANAGEVICLLGENGAGKTTLFRCIMGFLNNYAGDIKVYGKDLKNLSVRQIAEKIAYIPQAHEPIYNYTVSDIVLMGTTILVNGFQSPGKKELEGVYKVLEHLGIADLADRGYGELSGGERQLVLIARALAQKSKLLIMDEPTANLDFGNQIKVMKQAKSLAEQGYTILISTHNPEHALHFADKVLILDEGGITGYGAPASALTEKVISKVYGVVAEVTKVNTSWGPVPLIAPRV